MTVPHETTSQSGSTGRTGARAHSHTLAWFTLLAALLACLPAVAQNPQSPIPPPPLAATPTAAAQATSAQAAPAFVIWTTMRPTDGAARALAEWVAEYNKTSPEARVTVRFAALDEKVEQWASEPEPELPPDAYLATDAELLALAQAGRLTALDASAAKTLSADYAHIEAVALERVTSDARLWALPICADMTVEYVNTDQPTAGEAPPEDWAGFVAGKYSRWRGTSDHARPLLENAIVNSKMPGSGATSPTFAWKVLTAPGGDELGRRSLRVWAVALAAKSAKPRERALAVMQSLESGKTIESLLGPGGKLPAQRFKEVPTYLRQLHFEGPWLDAWAAKSGEKQPKPE